MSNINFVPDDYVQATELRRTNYIYLFLFILLMAALVGTFGIIKVRQRAILAKEEVVNQQIEEVQAAIQQFEQLQQRKRDMMQTAQTAMQLPDPVPRSILLACLTNNLPSGVTFLDLKVAQQNSQGARSRATTHSRHRQDSEEDAASESGRPVPAQTSMIIEGVAPSDLQVASYIERLNREELLTDVSLIESKKYDINEMTFRRFRLTARLDTSVNLTEEQISRIRAGYQRKRAF